MDFSFTEEQQAIRDLAAEILDDLVDDAMRKDFEGGKREAHQSARAGKAPLRIRWKQPAYAICQ